MSIASEISALTADKTAIASAITAKGGTVASGDGFDDFATAIASIPSGETVLSGSITPTAEGKTQISFTPPTGAFNLMVYMSESSKTAFLNSGITKTKAFYFARTFNLTVGNGSPVTTTFYHKATINGETVNINSSNNYEIAADFTMQAYLPTADSSGTLMVGYTYNWKVVTID